MFVLENKVHETLWGGKKLAPFAPTASGQIGHLYAVNCGAQESSRILTGSWKGQTLNAYFDSHKSRFGLDGYEYFPLVIAMVEAADDLSIQVHPDDAAASILDPDIRLGKNESWYFLDPPECGSIYGGCRVKTLEELRECIEAGRIEETADRVPVRQGDYVHITAGTLHSMARGSLVYEIEENAGCTYRFYDFDRVDRDGKRRPLQIAQAFCAVHPERKPVPRRYEEGKWIEEPRFLTQHFDSVSSYRNESGTLQVFTVLRGACEIQGVHAVCGTSAVLEPGDLLTMAPVEAIAAQPKPLSGF